MSVLRNKLKEKYSNIPNEMIEDVRLSHSTFRVLCYLFSRPNDWQINNTDISNRTGIKDPKTLANCFTQAIDLGWLNRERKRSKSGQLKGGYNYTLTESPKNPNTVKTLNRENTVLGKNGGHTKTDLNTNTNKSTKTEIKEEKDFFANAKIKNLQGEPTTIKKHIGTPQYRLLNAACTKVETYQLFRSMWLDGRCQILCDLLEYKRDIKKPYKKARGLASTIRMFTTFEASELKRAYEAMVTNEWNTIHPKRLKESKVIPMQQDPKFKFLTK